MKKLIIYALLAFAGWSYYQKNIAQTQIVTQVEPQAFQAPVTALTQPAQNFTCDGRQHCSQMNSRAEAEYFVRNCPNTKMDGDHDGEPCENDSRF
ncbi:excalibur calcium-binding domain-containing protein [Pseudomonas sp.]|uniref:excalibur calcium-binding domain-containing protein n=1 Tax=Pseudomonas sp. TaxID=306 RepID=UPI003BB4DD1F